MKKIITTIAIFFLFAYSKLSIGQTEFSIKTMGGYTNNAFANYLSLPDYYTNINAFLNHDWVSEMRGIRWFYDGSLVAFSKYQERTYHSHQVGLTYYSYFDENNNKLNAGVNTSKRYHKEAYHWYELIESSAYTNIKLLLSQQLYTYLGANFIWQEYTSLEAFSNWQSILYWRMSRFFDSGTTLILEADLLGKHYYPVGETSNIDDFPEIVTIGEGSSQQFVGMIKAAQALTAKTGISVQMLLRKSLTTSVRYLGSSTGYYYSDESLFDDIHGYNAEELNLTLKKWLPWNINLIASTTLDWKHYNQRLALDLDGVPFSDERLRADTRISHSISVKKMLKLGANLRPFTLSVNWILMQNSSNDPYYNYNTRFFTFGLSQNF